MTAKRSSQATNALQKGFCKSFVGLCAGFFLLGYLPGILAGQSVASFIGQQVAHYYTDTTRLSQWAKLFPGQAAASYLQLFFVWLFGFTAWGSVLLLVLFAGKGFFLGFCAANVLHMGGIEKLTLYWFSACFPNVLLLFFLLWLTGYSARLSQSLFQSIFLGGASRGQLPGNARRLTVRFLLCLPIVCLTTGLYSVFIVLLIRVFL